MKLQDTIEMMNSNEYKERFKAEYLQLKIRIDGLSNMLDKYARGELNFTPTCPYNVLHEQLVHMKGYKDILENRAIIENIDLREI